MKFANWDAATERMERGGWRCSSTFGFPGNDRYSEAWRRGNRRVWLSHSQRGGAVTFSRKPV